MWQNNKLIFLLLSLVIFTQALHLHQASDNYVNYLKGQQSEIKKKLDSLKDKIEKDYNKIAE